MTGPEHYAIAEGLLAHLDNIPDPHGDGAHAVDLLAAEAQVHATLAFAAAAALNGVGESPGTANEADWLEVTKP